MIGSNTITPPAIGGQKTDKQPGRYYFGGSVFSGGVGFDVGDTASPAGIWPGWGSMLWGTYGTYRAMLRHCTVAYVISQVLGPLLGSDWNVDADEGADPKAIEWVKDNIISQRATIMPHALRSVVFGNAPFELVWNSTAGAFVIDAFIPLLQDITQVMRATEKPQQFTGLKNGEASLAPAECLYILNGSDVLGNEPGDDYGRSRLENIRDTAWTGWLDTMRRLAELEDRVSGVVPVITVPAGTSGSLKADGVTHYTFAELAANILPALCHPRSQGAVLETPGINEADAGTDPARLKQLTTTVDELDMGSRAASQEAMLAKAKYWDEKIGEGLYRGERTLFATQGGTKADSGQHTANAEPDEEAIDNMIARQINQGPVKTGLVLNFGPDVLKTVRGIKPKPLVDEERISANDKVDAMIQNQKTADTVLQFIDGDKLFGLAGVPVVGKWQDVLKAKAEADKAAQDAKVQQFGGNGAPVNGNGMNGKQSKYATIRQQRMGNTSGN